MEEIQNSEAMGKTHKLNGKKVKEDIKEKCHQITEEEEERQKNSSKGLKRDMETRVRGSPPTATTENRQDPERIPVPQKLPEQNRNKKLGKNKRISLSVMNLISLSYHFPLFYILISSFPAFSQLCSALILLWVQFPGYICVASISFPIWRICWGFSLSTELVHVIPSSFIIVIDTLCHWQLGTPESLLLGIATTLVLLSVLPGPQCYLDFPGELPSSRFHPDTKLDSKQRRKVLKILFCTKQTKRTNNMILGYKIEKVSYKQKPKNGRNCINYHKQLQKIHKWIMARRRAIIKWRKM